MHLLAFHSPVEQAGLIMLGVVLGGAIVYAIANRVFKGIFHT